jgi:hypothetical protein
MGRDMNIEQMALAYLRGLARPWSTLFQRVAGLDLAAPDLPAALIAPRNIDRTLPGFGDFDPSSNAAIVPGDPASSLLYHALASPLVKPDGLSPQDYPSIASLDLIENYILSLAPLDAGAIPADAVIALFAYEYRPAPATTHRRQADFVYSRTGVSRVGEENPAWDGPNRCWLNIADGSTAFAVMPARFAAFLALPDRSTPTGISVLGGPQDGDDTRQFFRPIRKLFTDPGCINGSDLTIEFAEYHRREKLRRIFLETDLPKPAGLDAPPYMRDSTSQEASIAQLEPVGASVLVSAPPEPLVRLARLPSGEIASLTVPPRRAIPLVDFSLNRDNGSPSSMMIITGGLLIAGVEGFLQSFADVKLRPRNAPEFVNIRHRLTGDPDQPIEDLSLVLGDDFDSVMAAGGFSAALFEDSIADGCLIATVTGLPTAIPVMPAFSVLGAPKFFPYADEIDIEDWVEEYPSHNRQDQFQKGGPTPLNLGRFPPNLTLIRPDTKAPAFSATDDTAVALVGQPYIAGSGPTQTHLPEQDIRPEHRTTTFLSDGCSDVFAPGWDVTFSEQDGVKFYSTFGLGSPFPEDVKLCAAANAFWPAAAPDAARTFNRGPTAIPILDQELGYHTDNPRRTGSPSFGWDGEQGPFIAGSVVNYANITRSDYVSHALTDKTFSGAGLKDVDSIELIARMDALRLCIQSLPESSAQVDHTQLWLVHAEKVAAPPPTAAGVGQPCYRYEFVVPTGDPTPSPNQKNRLLRSFGNRYVCYVGLGGVNWAVAEAGPFTFVANPGSR